MNVARAGLRNPRRRGSRGERRASGSSRGGRGRVRPSEPQSHHDLMARVDESLAATLGERFRHARSSAGIRQLDVANQAGISRTMVTRMELGHGGVDQPGFVGRGCQRPRGRPSRRIPRARRAVARPRRAAMPLGSSPRSHGSAVGSRRRRSSGRVRIARRRAWRRSWCDRCAGGCCRPRLASRSRTSGPALDALEARCEQLRRSFGSGWTVSALVLCPSTTADRRRITELASAPGHGLAGHRRRLDGRVAIPAFAHAVGRPALDGSMGRALQASRSTSRMAATVMPV